MMATHCRSVCWMMALALIVGLVAVAPALGEETTWLAAAEADAAPASGGGKSSNPLPVTFGVEYTVVSDYIWRGFNLSEYGGEGREKANHQLDVSASAALKDLGLPDVGKISADVWFQFYGGYEALNPAADNNLQEIDYTIAWEYDLPDTPLTIGLGWIAYQNPHLSGDAHETFEIFGSIAMNDGFLFDQDDPVLNPSVAYYYDYDLVNAGVLVAAIKHEFALDEIAEGTRIIRDITLTPHALIIYDNRYIDKRLDAAGAPTGNKSNKFSSAEVGVEAGYDLGNALDIPADAGKLNLSVFINASHGMRRRVMADELYGGMKVGWEW